MTAPLAPVPSAGPGDGREEPAHRPDGVLAGAPFRADDGERRRRARIGRRVFVLHLAVCVVGLVVTLGARTPVERALVLLVFAVLTPSLTVVAVAWYRPVRAWTWVLVAAAELMWSAALALDEPSTWHPGGSILSVYELLSTAGYLTCLLALTTLLRLGNPRDRTLTAIDTAIITIAILTVVWAVNRAGHSVGGHHVSAYSSFAYPIFDALIAVAVVRMAARTTIARPAYLLAVAGASGLLVADLVLLVEPVANDGRVASTIQLVTFGLLGLAAVHPSMASITHAPLGHLGEIGRIRLSILGVALTTPAAILLLSGPGVDSVTALGLALGCATSLGLVLVRLWGIIRVADRQSDRLRGLARSDHLTGLPNRRTADAELERSLAEAARLDEPLVVGLLDLDRFKDYNDARGHAAGDRLLSSVGTSWRAHLPTDVFLGRYGGEEFLVVVRGREAADVAGLLERLRVTMPGRTTFSAGLAEWDGVEDPIVLVGRADAALYEAKGAGRACTWSAGPPGARPRAVGTGGG